jgi:hypothetical protein
MHLHGPKRHLLTGPWGLGPGEKSPDHVTLIFLRQKLSLRKQGPNKQKPAGNLSAAELASKNWSHLLSCSSPEGGGISRKLSRNPPQAGINRFCIGPQHHAKPNSQGGGRPIGCRDRGQGVYSLILAFEIFISAEI